MKTLRQSIAYAFGRGVVAVLLVVAASLGARAAGEGEVPLLEKMITLQYVTHKAGLSIRAGNLELADFYLHEMEEVIAEIGGMESYEGQPVGQLSGAMLEPVFHKLEEGVDSGDPEAALSAYTAVIDSCNACHVATTFGVIKIVDKSTENPYMQAFEK